MTLGESQLVKEALSKKSPECVLGNKRILSKLLNVLDSTLWKIWSLSIVHLVAFLSSLPSKHHSTRNKTMIKAPNKNQS